MMTDLLLTWAVRHGVHAAALEDLRQMLGVTPHELRPAAPRREDTNEARIQADLRLAAPLAGYQLFRNNVGALKDERGVPVRYGLANDTKALNKVLKSSDLIGWRSRLVQPDDVGHRIAQFVAIECKEPAWSYSADEREKAQLRFIQMVNAAGGVACFSTGGLPE